MKKRYYNLLFIFVLSSWLLSYGACSNAGDKTLERQAVKTMQKAAGFFITEVASHDGYIDVYDVDLTMRPTSVRIQPPGTPSVGMVFLDAYNATGDTLFFNGAISVARALAWGQLASGGWDSSINFEPVASKNWHYRRDIEEGDTVTSGRRNRSTLDDDKTQFVLRFLMRVDKALDFTDAEIHRAVLYGLDALLKVQYPNGAWPQQFTNPPDPAKHPVKKARYPDTWSWEWPGVQYYSYYTFNDYTIPDAIYTMFEAYKTYGDKRYLNSAKQGGDFIILAQMPEPQPAWAQQYNFDMEPTWARIFEPPSITGGETFGVLQVLLDLYLETGESRFLEPVPKALTWAENSLLPDGRLARFYELQTNRPLYCNAPRQYSYLAEPAFPELEDYALTYEDTDPPWHYGFKVPGADRIEVIKSDYNRILEKGRDAILAEREKVPDVDPDQIREIINSLDEQGRWVEKVRVRLDRGYPNRYSIFSESRLNRLLEKDSTRDPNEISAEAEIISTRTFIQNMSLLSDYIQSKK